MTNYSNRAENAPHHLYLVSKNQQLLISQFVVALEPNDPAFDAEKRIWIAPGERVTLGISTVANFYKELDNFDNLFLVDLSEGWQWEGTKLPSKSKLFAKKNTTSNSNEPANYPRTWIYKN